MTNIMGIKVQPIYGAKEFREVPLLNLFPFVPYKPHQLVRVFVKLICT